MISKMKNKTVNLDLSTLEHIDQAVLDFVKELNIHATTNKGWKPVPFVWTGAERAYQVKKDLRLRDAKGVLILPQMTTRRAKTSKNLNFKGKYWAAVPETPDKKGGMRIAWSKRINGPKTSEFERARALRKEGKLNFKAVAPLKENEKVVYEHFMIPNIVYLDLSYVVVLRCEYQQQMNEMLTPFLTKAGNHKYFLVKNGDWKYEAYFDDDFGQNDNLENFDEEERIFKAEIPIRVKGYIIGEGDNREQPAIAIRENAVEISFEESVLTDEEFDELFGKYSQ